MLDNGIEEELRIRHLQAADATRASLGLPVVEYVVTDTPLEVPLISNRNIFIFPLPTNDRLTFFVYPS